MQIAIAVHRTSLLKLTCKIALLIAEREHFLNLFSHNIYSVSCQVVGTGGDGTGVRYVSQNWDMYLTPVPSPT